MRKGLKLFIILLFLNGIAMGQISPPLLEQEPYYTFVENMPQFPGGDSMLNNFIHDNLIFPVAALENDIQGRVRVSFAIDTNGKIYDIRILKGLPGGCDQEVIKLLNTMPKWIPGEQNGKKVPVILIKYILFNLPKNHQSKVGIEKD